jgi:hypothetical protein
MALYHTRCHWEPEISPTQTTNRRPTVVLVKLKQIVWLIFGYFEIGEPVEELDEFCYLGSMVTKDGGAETDVNIRISKAKGAFSLLRQLWRSKEISRNTKLRIFNTNVKSVPLYVCETWKITQTISHKLQSFVNTCLRTIINSRWPEVISNHDLREKTKQKSISTEIQKKKEM